MGNIDQDDYYQFSLGEKRTVNIELSGLSDQASLYLYNSSGDTFSYDANGHYQGSSYVWKINSGEMGSISRLLESGDYFVRVFYESYNGLGTNYSLSMSAT